jgi:hypothetical protein
MEENLDVLINTAVALLTAGLRRPDPRAPVTLFPLAQTAEGV